ncbi:hypothetical protein HX049_16230 [Myroides odoratimimus]|uniref:hypothetical protein n=1 Tax=Myroides odoratimimus TaxID=76832 RepID=UPI0025772827|nr:hypothetical protein [Myroides odoratimimus]MDM1398694.1 hypothetical protein [Myroides odoratimimus]
MEIVLWIVVSLVFLGSLVMFIPSLMSLASPRPKELKGMYYWNNIVSKSFCVLVMLYPLVFLIAVLFYFFLQSPVLSWLGSYAILLILLFTIWNGLDKKVNGGNKN